MTEHKTQNHLPPEMLASLLQTVRRRQQSGDLVGARVVLRALAAQQPDDPRIWLALATVVERRDEQQQALEHALALDPHNALARRALGRFDTTNGEGAIGGPGIATPPASQATAPAADATPAPAWEENPARAIRWPLYLVVGVAAALVLVAAAALLVAPEPAAQAPAPTQMLPGAGAQMQPTPTSAPASPLPATAALPTAEPAASTTEPAAPTAAGLAGSPISTAEIASATPAPPPPTAPPALAPGEIVVLKPWHASLLRPDYAVLLDGAIGSLQPRGRFALALVTVGNGGAAPARLPSDLFTLQDGLGNRYQPLPEASAAYLNTYGRGQRGDLSMDEEIPAGGGNVSVPLIFDVPPDARNLTLHVGDQPLGWPIGGLTAAPNATPTP